MSKANPPEHLGRVYDAVRHMWVQAGDAPKSAEDQHIADTAHDVAEIGHITDAGHDESDIGGERDDVRED